MKCFISQQYFSQLINGSETSERPIRKPENGGNWSRSGMRIVNLGRDPFNQNSNRSDREKRTTSKGGPVFPKLFRLDRTDPMSFGPKFPESLVEWIAPLHSSFCVYSGHLLVQATVFKPFVSNVAFNTEL